MTVTPPALLAGLLAVAPVQVATPDSVGPPTVSTGVVPDTVTVGDRFHSHLRVAAPPGARVRLGAFRANDSLQLVDTVFVRRAEGGTVAAVYPLVAWVAGDTLSQAVRMTVIAAAGDSTVYQVPLRLPTVRSVLPADTTGLQPRPAKGLLLVAAERSHRWWLLLLPLALALGLLARRVLRRRPALARLDPRAEALAALDRLGDGGEGEPFYTAVTRVLRQYLARLEQGWGEELTTEELLERMAHDRAGLAALLRRADPVKFGGVLPPAGEGKRFAAEARAWILANPRDAGASREAA